MPDTNITDLEYLADQIAATLTETNPAACAQIRELLKVMGADYAQTLLQETLEVERNGGMMLPNGQRRRTPGGVFFFLARQKLTPEQQAMIFPSVRKAGRDKPEATAGKGQNEPATSTPQQNVPAEIEIGPEARYLAGDIARKLKDTDAERLEVIARLVQVGGMELAKETLEITLDMESQGGLRKKDGTRRSPGGAFLYITSRRLSEKQRRKVWPELPDELAPPVKAPPIASPSAAPIAKLPAPAGIATTAKMTLVGRPASVKQRNGFVEFQLENSHAPSLPKGLPTPEGATVYTIYVANKQWQKIAAAVENPLDALVIEGYPMLDAKTAEVILFATNVIGKLAQQAKEPPQPG